MVPPSTRLSGGSSAMASRLGAVTSEGWSSGTWRFTRGGGAGVQKVEGGFVGDGFEDEGGDVGEFVEAVVEIAEAGGLLGVEAAFECGDFFERAAESEQVARAGGAEGDFGEQAFEIEN